MNNADDIKNQILRLTKEYYKCKYKNPAPFKEGDFISYAGRVFDEDELCNIVDSSLEFWLTSGRYTARFEKELAGYLNVGHCAFVNSGSSANLLAFMALTSPLLKERRIKPGDEVITVAAGFPTTIAPIMQFGAVPVFIDITIPQYNADVSLLEPALSAKTRAVMLAHTLGNPFDILAVRDFCRKHGLWLIEDNCDSLGSEYYIDGEWKKTGTIGDIATSSFYPPHHITTGEGGAVYTSNPLLHKCVLSLRDWGRECQCASGMDNLCGARFSGRYGQLPEGYDHKYVYSHLGYNLKATDMQAAVGCAQIQKLDMFVQQRRQNWQYLKRALSVINDSLILPEPVNNGNPAWFGFMVTIKEGTAFGRSEIVRHLEQKRIQTRNLFAGNMVRQPCFDEMREKNSGFRVIGDLNQTDAVMNRSFWIGVYPGMTNEKLSFMADTIINFVKKHS